MPSRIIPLVTEEIYHVYNRGIDHRPTFLGQKEFQRAVELIDYYRFLELPGKYSKFIELAIDQQEEIFKRLRRENRIQIVIIAYCLMPNHFHFLLKQAADNGISRFMSNWQNSYTRYHNLRHKRTGPLFLDQFKAVRIQTEAQLLHVSRYIHLNPYSGYVVRTLAETAEYRWSSLAEFLEPKQADFCRPEMVLANFSKGKYKEFVFDQADYQRQLEKIKHLVNE